ncbi:MAG: hypothetical protein ACYDAZ_08420 [Thermoplasmataceae archaeon]
MQVREYPEARNWFLSVIREYREQYQRSTENIKKNLWNIDNFLAPCQVLSLTVANPRLSFIFVTKDKMRPDLEVKAYGPFETFEVSGAMIQILTDKNLYRKLSVEEKKYWREESFGDYLEGNFLGILEIIKNQPLVRPPEEKNAKIGWKKAIILDGFDWFVYIDDLWKQSPESFVKIIFEEAVTRMKQEPAETKSEVVTKQEELIEGFATYFYPHIWIGEVPKFTFKTRLEGLAIFPQPTFSREYKGRPVVVSQRGLLFIGEKEKAECLKLMNEIIGTSFLLGFKFDVIREGDIGPSAVSSNKREIRSVHYPISLSRNWQASKEFSISIDEDILETSLKFKWEDIDSIITKAEEITRNPDLSKSIIFLAQAAAHSNNAEFLESFILSWLIVERHFGTVWDEYLVESNITGKRKKKLTNRPLDFVIEQLSLSHRISEEVYHRLIELKEIRNDINHEGYVCTKSDVDTCFHFALNLMLERTGINRRF